MSLQNENLATRRVIWANHQNEVLRDDFIPCFPTIESKSGSLSCRLITEAFDELSPIYSNILSCLSESLVAGNKDNKLSFEIGLREPVVLIGYTLLDRILRLRKVLSENQHLKLAIADASEVVFPDSNQKLIAFVDGSQSFNQYLIARLGSAIWNLPTLSLENKSKSDARNSLSVENLTFSRRNLWRRIKHRASRFLSSRFGRVPALRLANIDEWLLDQGVYGPKKLIWVNPLEIRKKAVRDPELRQRSIGIMILEVADVIANRLFFDLLGFSEADAKKAANEFCRLMVELIPPNRFEGMKFELGCEAYLKSSRAPALVFCGVPGDEGILWIMAAKKLLIPVIGVQHGAHYGFSKHWCHIELEYFFCDKFVTWGWSKLPESQHCSGVETIPLPSPWLSERQRKWRSINVITKKSRFRRRYDVLWMTDRMTMFPSTVSTLRIFRFDLLSQLNQTMFLTADLLMSSGVRILHKPFNYTSADVQSGLIKSLSSLHPDHYTVHSRLDKGLTKSLLKDCNIVLWDEPGTGFFECLVSGIPSILLWDRTVSREESYAVDAFNTLESAQLVHRTPAGVRDAVSAILDDPVGWMADGRRKDAIADVVDSFARTRPNWQKEWDKAVMGKFSSPRGPVRG